MGGLSERLQDLYIRFLVWLGAEPPPGYEDLVYEEAGPREYTFKEGDTIFSVARSFGVHYERIAQANAIEDYEAVQPGQTVVIPPPDWQPEDGPLNRLEPLPEPAPPEPEPAPPPPDEAEIIEKPEPLPPPEAPAEEEEEEVVEEAPPAEEAEEPEWLLAEEPPEAAPEASPVEEAEPEGVEWLEEAEPVEIEPVVEEAPPEEEAEEMLFRYEVQRGDTLSAIANRYDTSVAALIEANEISDPSRIFPGQKLIIPGYSVSRPKPPPEPAPEHRPLPPVEEEFVYTVMSGDTLHGIAKRYDTTVEALMAANDLTPDSKLKVGQKLIIPGLVRPAKPVGPPPVTREPEPLPEAAIEPEFPPQGPLEAVRAMYVSYFAVGHADLRRRMFDLLETTEFNAVVIDAKSDFGWTSYPTQIPMAREIGAARPSAKDFEAVLAELKQRGVYTIARLVTFKDNALARSYPDYAVKTESGEIWLDSDEQGWGDPFLKPVWDYNIQMAVEAAQLGFDEIQFDYLRFPTASQAGPPQFSQDVNKQNRVAAITGFLSMARGQLRPLGVKVAADAFGYACWRKDDTLIGQDIERMAHYLDVLCPMLYPSTFGSGIPGHKFAIAYPYEVVYQSASQAVQRLAAAGCEVRPWLQDFPDYRFDKRVYGREEIQAQIKGCFDAGCSGFMVWDPRAHYTEGAYAPLRAKVGEPV